MGRNKKRSNQSSGSINRCSSYYNPAITTPPSPFPQARGQLIEVDPGPLPMDASTLRDFLVAAHKDIADSKSTINRLEQDLGVAKTTISCLDKEKSLLHQEKLDLQNAALKHKEDLDELGSKRQLCFRLQAELTEARVQAKYFHTTAARWPVTVREALLVDDSKSQVIRQSRTVYSTRTTRYGVANMVLWRVFPPSTIPIQAIHRIFKFWQQWTVLV